MEVKMENDYDIVMQGMFDLDDLIDEGKIDSVEAEALRDKIEASYIKLSPEQQLEIQGKLMFRRGC
jgi:hypothetical protein